MPIFEIETDQGVFEIDADREPTQEEALQAIGAQFQPTKPSRVSKETPQTGVLPGEELSPLQQTALTAGLLPVGVAYATAPKEVRQQMTAPIEASAFGALQAAGELPGGLATVGTSSALQSVPVLNLASAISQLFGGPTTSSVAQQITEPVQDLTPKIFRAMGVETATPEGPQFKAPGFAAGGEFIANIAPLPTPAAKVPELAKSVSKAVSGDVVSNAPRLIRSAIKPTKAQAGAKVEKALESRFADIYHANPEARTFEEFTGSVQSKLDETAQKLNEARASVGQANEAGPRLADALNRRADRLQASGGKADEILSLRQRAEEVGNITTVGGLQDAVTDAGRRVNWNQPRTRVDEIADEVINQEGGRELNRLFEEAKGPEAATIRKEWSDYKTIADEANNRLNKIINQAPPNLKPAVIEALSSAKGLAGIFALIQGYGSGAVAVGAAGLEAFFKKASRQLKDPNEIIGKLYNDLSANPPPLRAPPRAAVQAPPILPTAESPIGGGVLTPGEALNQQIAQSLQGGGVQIVPRGTELALEAGTVRPTAIATPSPISFSPTPGTTIPIETVIEQQRMIQALSDALRQIQAQAAQRASVSEQIAQQLGQSSRVPRIFLPEQP